MRIAAVADVHSPRYLNEFRDSLSKCRRPDLILLAGDMINLGKVSEYRNIIDAIDSFLGEEIPITACFGNEEIGAVRDDISLYMGDRIDFLNESSFKFDLHGTKVGIVGVSTFVDDETNNEDMRVIFEKRAKHILELLSEVKKTSTYTFLMLHYSPLETSNEGDSDTFSWWISKAVEDVQPDFIIHGHVHKSTKLEVTVGRTRIVNVAFPAVGKVTEIVLSSN